MERIDIIKKALAGDTEILKYCDPLMFAATTDDVAEGIEDRIQDYEEECECHFEAIGDYGYVFFIEGVLISFAIDLAHRKTDELWDKIKEGLGEKFFCILHRNNTRAIKWLIKKGMKLESQNNSITILCQSL